jgi:hypothetical protein
MSTEVQLKGDSRHRQLEASRAYAEANALELAEGAELEDIGVSAFKGANAREGALGQFLEAVKAGAVKSGSYLIVESLDRLSREEVLTALSLFLSIIQAGIHLVTLAEHQQPRWPRGGSLNECLRVSAQIHNISAARVKRRTSVCGARISTCSIASLSGTRAAGIVSEKVARPSTAEIRCAKYQLDTDPFRSFIKKEDIFISTSPGSLEAESWDHVLKPCSEGCLPISRGPDCAC